MINANEALNIVLKNLTNIVKINISIATKGMRRSDY
jgi:hypothetical protein